MFRLRGHAVCVCVGGCVCVWVCVCVRVRERVCLWVCVWVILFRSVTPTYLHTQTHPCTYTHSTHTTCMQKHTHNSYTNKHTLFIFHTPKYGSETVS